CKGRRCRRRAPQIPQERPAQWQGQRGRNPPVFLKCSYSLDHPPDYGRVPLGTDAPCDFRILSIVDVSPVKFRTMSRFARTAKNWRLFVFIPSPSLELPAAIPVVVRSPPWSLPFAVTFRFRHWKHHFCFLDCFVGPISIHLL